MRSRLLYRSRWSSCCWTSALLSRSQPWILHPLTGSPRLSGGYAGKRQKYPLARRRETGDNNSTGRIVEAEPDKDVPYQRVCVIFGGSSRQLHTSRREQMRDTSIKEENPKVFIIDDDVSVLESLEGLISAKGWQTQIFSSAQEFLSNLEERDPCCLVLDVSLPGISGLDLQKRLNTDGISIPIIFITGFGDIPMSVRAMKAGAVEFLTKPFSHEDLFCAIAQAIERSRFAIRHQTEVRELRQRHSSLSKREQEVMTLVVSGLLNKQVGFELGISEITVKAHRGQVMRKMKANSLADLVTMAAKLAPSDTQA